MPLSFRGGVGVGQSEVKAQLKTTARKLRNKSTEPERRLWNHLRSSQLGFKFRRQVAIPPFVVDFLCPAKAWIVEVDGWTHNALEDQHRDTILEERGFTTLRVTNTDVMGNVEGVLHAIASALKSLPDRWPSEIKVPHPHPSPKGEGL